MLLHKENPLLPVLGAPLHSCVDPKEGRVGGFTETLNLGKYTGFHLGAETTQGSVFPNYPFENDLLQALRTASWAHTIPAPNRGFPQALPLNVVRCVIAPTLPIGQFLKLLPIG